MNLRSLLAATLGVAAITQFASPADAASLINETFNTVSPGLNLTGSVGSATVTSGNVDVVAPGQFGLYPGYAGGNFLDLNGTTSGTIAFLSQNVLAGDTLKFDFGANGAGSANVTFGALNIGPIISSGGPLTTFNYTFLSAASGALTFASTNAGSGGIVLDNIKLDTATSVPEPEAFPGLLLFAGGALMLRKKLAKSRAE